MSSRRREPRLGGMRISDSSLPLPVSHLSEIRSHFPRARSTEMATAALMAPQDTFGSWSTDGLTALSSAMCPLTETRSSSSLVCRMRILTLLTVTVVLAVPAGLWAHATLVRSEPKAGAALTGPPTVVRAWFDDELDPDRSTIGVWDVREHRVDDGGGGVDLRDLDRKSMMARPRAVGAGTDTVRWRACARGAGGGPDPPHPGGSARHGRLYRTRAGALRYGWSHARGFSPFWRGPGAPRGWTGGKRGDGPAGVRSPRSVGKLRRGNP